MIQLETALLYFLPISSLLSLWQIIYHPLFVRIKLHNCHFLLRGPSLIFFFYLCVLFSVVVHFILSTGDMMPRSDMDRSGTGMPGKGSKWDGGTGQGLVKVFFRWGSIFFYRGNGLGHVLDTAYIVSTPYY